MESLPSFALQLQKGDFVISVYIQKGYNHLFPSLLCKNTFSSSMQIIIFGEQLFLSDGGEWLSVCKGDAPIP